VCVIGSEVATNLFQRAPALGNKIKIGPNSFEVVGVLEKQGSFMGQFSLDNQAIIPLKQFVSSFWRRPDYEIQIKAIDLGKLEEAKEELRSVLRLIRRVPPGAPDDFSINQQEQFISMFNKVTTTIAAVGLFITGLSLFVGGIGIMNIMFVSVAERTREIGLRKAIGAKRRTILVQFLIEAASICMLGGLLALAIAWPMTLVMSKFLPAVMSITVASIALLVSFVTGILSGFFPAWRAARMNPVDALRNE
jgi:putative ABC transport system permease protein